jgi:transcriptional regulator with GAF, ATPase, and Fis domain
VAVNCGALSETLLESELFGHEKGSFTGAHARRRGRFEMADGGTLFLDEISETTPTFQSRLLRVLQEGTFERLGGERTLHVDVRIIAATNTDLKTEVEAGRFREDLYYRLAGFSITIPPLRDRHTDIPVLIRHFLKKHGYDQIASLSDRVRDLMRQYPWPGNVRELENVVRRAAILAQSSDRDVIRQEDLPKEILESDSAGIETVAYESLDTQILTMLRAYHFSRSAMSQTARALDNRDRGTITEYFRGICFEALVRHDFDVDKTSRNIADTDEPAALQQVKKKIQDYLRNLEPYTNPDTAVEVEAGARPSCFLGLPKKYHSYLIQILDHFSEGP